MDIQIRRSHLHAASSVSVGTECLSRGDETFGELEFNVKQWRGELGKPSIFVEYSADVAGYLLVGARQLGQQDQRVMVHIASDHTGVSVDCWNRLV